MRFYQGRQFEVDSTSITGACEIAHARGRDQVFSRRLVGPPLTPATFEAGLWLLLFLCMAGSLVPAAKAYGLDPNRRISQYGHRSWSTQEGHIFPDPSLAQTADGYIWTVGKRTFLHFDGIRFSPVILPKGPRPGRSVSYLFGSHDGSFWIGGSGGLGRFKDGKLSILGPTDGAGINTIFEDHAGRVWVTRYRVPEGKGTVCEVVGGGLRCYGRSDGLPAREAFGITEDPAGYLWIAGANLYRWKPGTKASEYLNEIKHPVIVDVAVDHAGDAWAAMDGVGPQFGVRYFHHGIWAEYATAGFHSSHFKANALFVDRDGSVWIGTQNDGLYRVSQGTVDHFSRADGLSGRNVSQILEDHEGNLWVATDGGMDMFRNLPATNYTETEGLSNASATSVFVSRDGFVWAGAYNGAEWSGQRAADILRPGPNPRFSPGPKLPGRIESMFQDHSGALWLGLGDTISVYDHGKVEKVFDRNGQVLHIDSTPAIAEDSSHTILALSETHLFLIKGRHAQVEIPLPKPLPSLGFLTADMHGGTLMGQGRRLMRYQDGRIENYALPGGQISTTVMDAIADPADPLLLATRNGLLRWDGRRWQVLNEDNGLPCNYLESFIKDRHGSLWIESGCGLLKMESSELQRWRGGEELRPRVTTFDVSDGVQTGRPYTNQPQMSLAPNGRVWFANGTTIESIDPDQLYENHLPPPVHVEQLIADGRDYQAVAQPHIPPNTRNLEIDYTGISLSNPQKVLFRYLLEGHDKDWQGPVTRRQAFYTDLAPGTYRFRVIACNNSGVWNSIGAVANFVVEPTFYQTLWFKCLVGMAAACSFWFFYTLRLRKATAEVHARLGERLQERERIARELHDTLLQDLQAVVLRFQLVANKLTREDPNRLAMEVGLNYADKVLADGRHRIRGIRADTRAMDELSKSLATYGEELAQLWPLSFHLTVIGEQFELYPVLRDEIYRIGREAIGNAFNHSKGSTVEVEIAYLAAEFRMRISDNGDGIDPNLVDQGRPGHWGIDNMRQRAQKIGAVLSISGRPKNGTSVELTVPVELARQGQRSWFLWPRKNNGRRTDLL